MKNLSTVEIIDELQYIEDGINAAHVVGVASGDVLSDEDRNEALEWIFGKLSESTNGLRAELTAILFNEKENVG